jgi:hypothetical protein
MSADLACSALRFPPDERARRNAISCPPCSAPIDPLGGGMVCGQPLPTNAVEYKEFRRRNSLAIVAVRGFTTRDWLMLRSRARSSLLWGCSACALVAIAAAFPQPLVPGRTLLAPRVGGARVRFNTRPMCALSCSRAARFHPGTGPGGRSRVRALKLLMMGIVAILWCPATGEGENAATRTTRAGPHKCTRCALRLVGYGVALRAW